MKTKDTEVLVLGGGPGGYTAAFRAADLGKKVCIVDAGPTLGGVCLNVGCIPSKALLHAAEVLEQAREAGSMGIHFAAPKVDLDKLRAHKEKVVGTLTGGLSALAKRRKVEVLWGTGSFIADHVLKVEGEGEVVEVHFEYAILATGSRPVKIPGFPHDDPRVWDSTDALALKQVPKRLFILGGGIIGLEMATVYQALGSEITLVEMLDQLIPPADADVVKPLHKRLEAKGLRIHLGTKVDSIKAETSGLRIAYGSKEELFDAALVSVGRLPNTDFIGLDKCGLVPGPRGIIGVDEARRTSVAHIFAIGDITGQPMLAHKAVHEARVAAEVIAGLKSGFDALSIPSVAYTQPEIAWTGLTEKQAKQEGVAYTKGVFPWGASGRAISQNASEGFTKVLFAKDSHRIIGAAIVGAHAGELIAEANLALEMGADAVDLSGAIHPHPTLSETLALAAEVAEGTVTDL